MDLITCLKCKSSKPPVLQTLMLPSHTHLYRIICKECEHHSQRENTIAKATENWNEKNNPRQEADYMLLGRLQMDCLYNIGQGAILRLHQKTVVGQISKMRELLSGLVEKPDWISMEDILKFEEGLKALDLKTVHKTERLHGSGYGPLCKGSGTYRSQDWESVDCPDCLKLKCI